MEWAEKTPSPARTRFRYAMGVIAPAVAWPSLFMPMHFALTAQFAAFAGLYFADVRATARGWTPPWYGTYRFVLTFITGGAIFITLIGRAKIGDERPPMSHQRIEDAMHERGAQLAESYGPGWAAEEEKERKRLQEEKEQKEKEEKEKKKNQKSKGKDKGKGKGKEQDDGKKEQKDDDAEESDGDDGDDENTESDDDGDDGEKSDDSGDDGNSEKGDDNSKDDKKDKKPKDEKKDDKKEDKKSDSKKKK
jgi:hypothetical protein